MSIVNIPYLLDCLEPIIELHGAIDNYQFVLVIIFFILKWLFVITICHFLAGIIIIHHGLSYSLNCLLTIMYIVDSFMWIPYTKNHEEFVQGLID